MSLNTMWTFLIVSCSLVYRVTAVVGGKESTPPDPDEAVVFLKTKYDTVRLEGIKNETYNMYSFLGIRYAMPPIGERRFQRPSRSYLTGDVSAKVPCQLCPQMNQQNNVIGHEDCLCLSVYAPKMPGDEKGIPVIVFFHGGNYKTGGSAYFGGKHIVKKNTILVTVQYRLGALGFLSANVKDVDGNMGLFDMNLAVEWVKNNIEFFGGDTSRIILMGHGSGGSAASILGMSKQAPRIAGVVAMSGTSLSPGAIRSDPNEHFVALAKRIGCPYQPPERLINCLKKMPFQKIVKADIDSGNIDTTKFLDDISGRSGAGARVEGINDKRSLPPLVDKEPAESMEDKHDFPLLTGVTTAETSRAVYGKYFSFLSNKLSEVEDFVKKELVGSLQSIVNQVNGLVPLGIGKQTEFISNYYQAVFENSIEAIDGLSKIAEATGDALFNLPAYQSVKQWRNGAQAFLYSFDHLGNLTKGKHFLPGVVLAADSNAETENKMKATSAGPAHGDELGYIFEALNEKGEPIEENASEDDEHVRDGFVNLLSVFVHKITLNETKSTFPFSLNNEQFIQIGKDISIGKDFRFCEIGMWSNIADRLKNTMCKDLFGNIEKLKEIPKNIIQAMKPLASTPTLTNGKGKKENSSKSGLGFGIIGL